MNTVLKNSILASVVMLVAMLGIISAHALDYQNYPSYIEISHNSNVRGQDRDYPYSSYSLTIVPSTLEDGPLSPGYVRLSVDLIHPKYFLGIESNSDTLYSGKINFSTAAGVGNLNVQSLQLGNRGNGKRYFHFSTWGSSTGAGYGALRGSVTIANFQ